jgi:hypothetical protein
MSPPKPQKWFEMMELRRRKFADAVWIPLRAVVTLPEGEGIEELVFCGSVAFPPDKRAKAEELGWSHLGAGRQTGPYAFRSHRYKAAEAFQINEGEDDGVDLVLMQDPRGGLGPIWHVNQDLILALNLVQEGDEWLRPQEDFAVVMRQKRNAENEIVAIEIKREFLADYLAARGLALRLAYYRRRQARTVDRSHIAWPEGGLDESKPHDRFEARVYEVDETGGPYGGRTAVFHMWRTDVDPEEDVPVFGPETGSNTDGRSRTFVRGGQKFFRIEGELWREEWIEAGPRSERVRGDKSVETISYIIDGAGSRATNEAIHHEDIGRWLWFDPRVIPAALNRRGAEVEWYTRETGNVTMSQGWRIHFGINRRSLVTVYAYDIAKLPLWQQRVWAGFNVSPEDSVSSELLAAQMQGEPAETIAAEAVLPRLLRALDAVVVQWLGAPLFHAHHAADDILARVHRFRALEQGGVLALAKDLARLTADRIDPGPLQQQAPPPKSEKRGSLKSLEKALATICSADEARALLTPLVGIYELRLGDAHLPSEQIAESFELIGLDVDAPLLLQGQQLIELAVSALMRIQGKIRETVKANKSRGPR